MDWPDALGVIHNASQAEPNRTDRAWKTNVRYELEAFTLHTEPDRACSLADYVNHKALIKYSPATLFFFLFRKTCFLHVHWY